MIFISQPYFPMTQCNLFFKGGMLLDPPQQAGLGILCQKQILRGTQKRSREQFLKALEELGTDLNLAALGYSFSIGSTILNRFLSPFFELLAEALTSPALSHEEIEKSRSTLRPHH